MGFRYRPVAPLDVPDHADADHDPDRTARVAFLPAPRYGEFDYTGLLQPTAEEQIPLLIAQLEAGLITLDEARKIQNLPPLGPRPVPEPADEEEAV